MNTTQPTLAWSLIARIFIPFAMGYFLSYLYRVVNTIIASDLSRDIQIDAAQLGLLTSSYLIAFAAFQLPLGILLDRYGPRRINALLLLIAALGAATFASADSLSGLMLGRALIGLGVSACLMAAFKSYVQWFPKDKLAMVNGLQLAAGGLGILTASTPVEFALQFIDWRGVFWILTVATVVVSACVYFIVPDHQAPHANATLGDYIKSFIAIFTDKRFYLIAPWSVTTQAVFLSVMSLWSGPWLRDVVGLEREHIAQVLFWLAIGIIAGYALLGLITTRLAKFGISNTQVGSVGMITFMLLQIPLVLGISSWVTPLWVLLGFFGTTGTLAYAHMSQQFPSELAGRVNTALNLLVFIFAFISQWGIGEIINAYSAGSIKGYAPEGYQAAFSVTLVLQIVAMLLFFYHAKRLSKAG